MNLKFKPIESFMVTDIVGLWSILALYYLCELQKGTFFTKTYVISVPDSEVTRMVLFLAHPRTTDDEESSLRTGQSHRDYRYKNSGKGTIMS